MSVEVRNFAHGLKHENTSISSKRNLPSKFDQENSFQNDQSQDGKSFNQGMEERNLPEDILMLEEHQAICEREGRYVEAEIDKNRIAELKAQLEIMRREELMGAHMQEKQKVEEEQMNEFSEFNEFWDRKMQEFNEQAGAIEEQMIQRHQDEMRKFLEELEMSLPVKPKDSAELLNLRKIQQTLAKQKDYIEAHKVQQRCIKLEREEAEKWHVVKEQKIKNQRAQLEHKQVNELNAIRKRITTGQEEQRKARSLDLERLLHKYQNIRKEISVRQQNEMLQISKPAKTSGSIFGSTFKSQSSSKLNTSTNSIYKSTGSKLGGGPKRQPLHDAGNVMRTNVKPLQEKKKNI